jgi:hypothetical protein
MQSYNRSTENKSTVPDDPKARELLRRAAEKTYRWPKDFKGFSVDLIIEQAGKTSKGRAEIRSAREVTVALDDEALGKWAEGQIGMMAIHRMPRSFDESDGKYSLTLGDPDHHPYGQRININGDGMNSHYRVHDGRITQINRRMERIAFTINVEDSLVTTDGHFLTTRYSVYYFSPTENRLVNVDTFLDSHAVVDGVYLPGTRWINSVEDQGVVTRKVQFLNHQLNQD